MLEFARRPAEDLQRIFREAGAQRTIGPHIIEKDFWVCWCLKRLFSLEDFQGQSNAPSSRKCFNPVADVTALL